MNIHLENVSLHSTSGPNHFASKLVGQFKNLGIKNDDNKPPDARLCFIESRIDYQDKAPLIQRLDGIYFNTLQDYNQQNENIKKTYDIADGVIFQSYFNKSLTEKYFKPHKNNVVIHNGADLKFIKQTKTLKNLQLDKFENVWCCASSWRPHKRLEENIRYFLEHSSEKECLVIAGKSSCKIFKNERIFYVGEATIPQLISLYKRSKYFLHLAWLDHCPNVVVDARASGCQIICSSAGGTKEIAGETAIIIQENEWDYSPVRLYDPPKLDFSRKILKNNFNKAYNISISDVAKQYIQFIRKNVKNCSRNTNKNK